MPCQQHGACQHGEEGMPGAGLPLPTGQFCDKIQRLLQNPDMALIVQKFGGTSVGTTERIKHVAARVAKFRTQGHSLVVVVSAISGETNRLLALAKELQAEPEPRELDVVLATGEQVTIGLLCMALIEHGIEA